jgi:sugar phosphate isomerase/epimerase
MLSPQPTISLQLYTIRNQLVEDPELALQKVKSIGIDWVEIAPLSDRVPAARLSQALQSCGLKPVAIHSELPIGDGLGRTTQLADDFNCRTIIWHGWPRDPDFDSNDGVDRLINLYNEAQVNLEHHGLEFGLHNHWWEFEPIKGQLPYRRMVERLNPGIFFEVDTYWVRTAGFDPSKVLAELGGRVKFLHMKDGPGEQGKWHWAGV